MTHSRDKMSCFRKKDGAKNVAFCGDHVSLFSDIQVIKTEISWVKRILFAILGVMLINLGALILRAP